MASVGATLKKIREKKKISLDQITQETKIAKKYLLAIESDNYTIFPGETYIIGFIRNYARALGLEPSEIINQYKSMKIGTNIEESQSTPHQISKKEKVISESLEEVPKKKEEETKIVKKKKTPSKTTDEQIEVVELEDEEIVIPKKKTKKMEPILTSEPKIFKPPLKEKKLISLEQLIIGIGAIIIGIILIFIIKFIITSFSPKKSQNIVKTDLQEIKLLEFTDKVLQNEFVNNEYYKIKLGDKIYDILFEKISEVPDVTQDGRLQPKNENTEFVFKINDISVPLKLNEEKIIDFDYDTVNDLKIKIRSYHDNLINARIDKLHSFLTVKTEEKINIASTSEKTNNKSKTKKSGLNSEFGQKKKIIFDATVIKKVYFQAWIDGKEQEGLIYYPYKNNKIHLEANEVLQLKIGNAACLKVKINGQPVKLGKSGEIVNKIIKWEKDPYDESVYKLVMKDWQ